MNKFRTLLSIVFAAITAFGLGSCMGDDNVITDTDSAKYLSEMFESMKGSYSGTLAMPDNSVYNMKFRLTNDANVEVSTFPLDRILNGVYGGTYTDIRVSGDAVPFSAPIDSVGYALSEDGRTPYLSFVTKNDLQSNRIDFSFTKDGASHAGWALVTTKGLYNTLVRTLSINFIVTDIIIDNQDCSASCPIDHYMENTQKDS